MGPLNIAGIRFDENSAVRNPRKVALFGAAKLLICSVDGRIAPIHTGLLAGTKTASTASDWEFAFALNYADRIG